MPEPEETSSSAEESGQNADKAWLAKPFNKGFALFMIGAVIVVALIMAYYLLFAVKQASPGVKSALPPGMTRPAV